jgi:hypothetical protein
MEWKRSMVQAQQVKDSRIAPAQHASQPMEKRDKRMGFWGTLGMSIIALFWLVSGKITNNKRHLIL